MLAVHPDSEEDLSPGEFSPRAPVHSTAKKGRAGKELKEPVNGFARAFDLGEKCSVLYEETQTSLPLWVALERSEIVEIVSFVTSLITCFVSYFS